MIFISYYTANTPYEQVVQKYLLPSLKARYLKYDIKKIKDRGSWQKNTHIKAEFIKEMLLKHKTGVVFLDADATVERFPILFYQIEHKYDISFHYLDFNFYWKGKSSLKREALSGTLYLNYNKKVLKFLDEWIEMNKTNTQWEQKNMQAVLKKWDTKLKIYPLPLEYVAIVKGGDKVPYFIKNPFIIHHQASRKYRNWKSKRK